MTTFEKYLKALADHEDKKTLTLDPNFRNRILINSGARLNWIGDFLANPKNKFKKVSLPLEKIYFTGTNPEWNKILLVKCHRLVAEFIELIKKNDKIKAKFVRETTFNKEPILVRRAENKGYYKVSDGIHRLIAAILKGHKKIDAFVPVDEGKYLPICEAHVVYDLIRGYLRHAKDKKGAEDLFHGLCLLKRCYSNVPSLLKNRFNFKYVADESVQEVIKKVLENN
jgi:hypothetical protein